MQLMRRPVIGITCDTTRPAGETTPRYMSPRTYAAAVHHAGGVAVLLPHEPAAIDELLRLCDGFLLAGGDDPDPTAFGEPPHPAATLMDPDRQAFELALLERLDATPAPVLGVCLGMQLMALHHGGRLLQDLPAPLAAHHREADHAVRLTHPDAALPGEGVVHSRHHQAIVDPGRMRCCAVAEDEVIEAVDLPASDGPPRLYLGVQWHPERTAQPELGPAIFEQLVRAADETRRRGAG
jgi:putative glutamine amidotransferase